MNEKSNFLFVYKEGKESKTSIFFYVRPMTVKQNTGFCHYIHYYREILAHRILKDV